METCEHCSSLLFDFLYDLLDAGEAQSVRAHLADCPACREKQARAAKQQELIAKAARMYKTVPAFTPPASLEVQVGRNETALPAQENIAQTVTHSQTPPRRKAGSLKLWLSATVAASLAFVFALAWFQYGLKQRQQDLNTAKIKSNSVDREWSEYARKHAQMVAAQPDRLQDRQLQLQIVGTANYQPTAKNPLCINATNLAGKPAPTDLTISVHSEDDKEIYRSEMEDVHGPVTWALPSDLAVESEKTLQLEVKARSLWSSETVTQQLVVAPERYLTHVFTSKPAYDIGELLFFRTLTLEQYTLKPPGKRFRLCFSLVNEEGEVVKKLIGHSQPDGVSGGEFALSDDLAEGKYSLRVTEMRDKDAHGYSVAPQTAAVRIRRPQTPKLALDQNCYFPGDKMNFLFQGGYSPHGNSIANQPLTVTFRYSEPAAGNKKRAAEPRPVQLRADNNGYALGQLAVPEDLPAKTDAEVEIQIHDGKRDQKFVHPVKVVVPKWDAEIFAEGGQFVADVPNRVYCRINTPGGKAGQPSAQLVNGSGEAVAAMELASHRRKDQSWLLSGSCQLTPNAGETYKIRVHAGNQVVLEKPLPKPTQEGASLIVANAVADQKTPIRFSLHSASKDLPLLIVATCRGQLVGHQLLSPSQRQRGEMTLPLVDDANGVVRLTVYEPRTDRLIPLAERLIYRIPEKKLNLSCARRLQADGQVGQKVQLQISSENEQRLNNACSVLALVVNENAAHPAVKQRQQQLPAFFYVTSQLQHPADLENAEILLGGDAQARDALDRFLAIEGWRTFVKQQTPVAATELDLLGANAKADSAPLALFCRDNFTAAKVKYEKAKQRQIEQGREELARKRDEFQREKEDRNREIRAAWIELNNYRERWQRYFGFTVVGTLLAALVLGVTFLLVGLGRLIWGSRSPLASFGVSFAALALCMTLYAGSDSLRTQQAKDAPPKQLPLAEAALPAEFEAELAKPAAQSERVNAKLPTNQLFAFSEQLDRPQETSEKKGESNTDSAKEIAAQTAVLKPHVYLHYENSRQLVAKLGLYAQQNQLMKSKRFQDSWLLQEKITKALPAGTAKMPFPNGPIPGIGTSPGPNGYPFAGGKKGKTGQGKQNHAGDGKGGAKSGKDKADYYYARAYCYDVNQQGIFYADTLLWHPNLTLENGTAEVNFDIPAHPAVYRVYLMGHDDEGRLGYFEKSLHLPMK